MPSRSLSFSDTQVFGVTMRYVRAVEDTKGVAVEAVKLSGRKSRQVLASWPKQPPGAGGNSLKTNGGAEGVEPLTSALRTRFS